MVSTRIAGTIADPLPQGFLLGAGKRSALVLGRHLQVVVILNGFQEQTLVRLARYHGRSVVAALFPAAPCIECQSALALSLHERMAAVALGDEQGPNMLLEMF